MLRGLGLGFGPAAASCARQACSPADSGLYCRIPSFPDNDSQAFVFKRLRGVLRRTGDVRSELVMGLAGRPWVLAERGHQGILEDRFG